MTTIGDRLKAVRRQKRMTQPELAALIGLSVPSISSIEINRSSPNDTLLNIAQALEVDPNWLINGEGVTPDGVDLHISREIDSNRDPYRDFAIKKLEDEIERLWKLVEKLTGANFPKSPKIARAAKLGVLLGDHLGVAA